MFTGSKLNLFLQVTGRRPDGYHTLNTLFWPLDTPSDVLNIEFEATEGVSLDCTELPNSAEENLAFRAANVYAQYTGISPSWHIELKKSTPIAAGLGGGSADAAAVLKILNSHYALVSPKELVSMALKLGADVPFFLTNRPALATGIGEILTLLEPPLTLPPLVLVFPKFPVTAKWAYQHKLPPTPGNLELLLSGLRSGNPDIIGHGLHNDLSPALYKKFPMLRMIKQQMLTAGAAGVEITGSGSSIFAVAHNRQEQENIAAAISQNFTGVQIFQLDETIIK